jgi:hypothetical protein
VKTFVRMTQKKFNLLIKKVRSDNRTEFKNTQVEECWGPSASEGPQKHDLTMFLEYNV